MPMADLPGFAILFDAMAPAIPAGPVLPPEAPLPDPTAEIEETISLIEGEEVRPPPSPELPSLPMTVGMPPPLPLVPMPEPTTDPTPPPVTIRQPDAAPATPLAVSPAPQTPPPIPPEGRLPARTYREPEEPRSAKDAIDLPAAARDRPAPVTAVPMLPVATTELTQTETGAAPDSMLAEPGLADPAPEPRRNAESVGHAPRAQADGHPSPEKQIATAVTVSATGKTEILLDPQDLGRVRVSLDGSESALVVTIEAEKHETVDLLRRNADLLMEEFRDAGYTSLSFSFAQRGDDAPQPFAPAPPEEGEGPATPVSGPPSLPAMALRATGLSSLDIRL